MIKSIHFAAMLKKCSTSYSLNFFLLHFLLFGSVFIAVTPCLAGVPNDNSIALGQGIASPNTTSLVNLNRGLLAAENPAGLMYQDGYRASYEMSKDTVTGSGFELAAAGNKYGIAIGSYSSGCTGCVANTALVLAAEFGIGDLGLRYYTSNSVPTYGLGYILNPKGTHRIGLHVEQVNPAVAASTTLNTGFGYSYDAGEDTINLEATQSKPASGATSSINSFGYRKKVSSLEVSMTYEVNATSSTDTFWMGTGFKGQSFHLGVYAQYAGKLWFSLNDRGSQGIC